MSGTHAAWIGHTSYKSYPANKSWCTCVTDNDTTSEHHHWIGEVTSDNSPTCGMDSPVIWQVIAQPQEAANSPVLLESVPLPLGGTDDWRFEANFFSIAPDSPSPDDIHCGTNARPLGLRFWRHTTISFLRRHFRKPCLPTWGRKTKGIFYLMQTCTQ